MKYNVFMWICLSLTFLTTNVAAQGLCVGTYNIRNHHNDDAYEGNGWKDRCPVICNQLLFEQPDIFGTQEGYRDQLQDMLALMPGYAFTGIGREDGRAKGEHSAIFYRTERLELLAHGDFWLGENPTKPAKGWDAACERICSWGRFRDRTTGRELCFFNLHMDHVGVVARRESARLVMACIDSIAQGKPTILTGDFNVDQRDEIHGIFTQSGLLRDCYEAARVRFAENGTYNAYKTARKTDSRIDHVFVTKHWTVDRYGILTNSYWRATGESDSKGRPKHERRNPSDHYPVLVHLLQGEWSSMLFGNVSAQKEIYIPKELRGNDFECDSSRLSYKRMAQTDNFVMFWERGFGHDLSCPPKLEGHEMKVDVERLMAKVERFYRFYADTLGFLLPGSKAERYKMMAILNYSLEGTAYGGDYDRQIGALWIAPNRLQDEKLNCIAHELGHSFQSQIVCDGTGKAWGGGGIFEMASQWMLWQVNPEWVYDEAYHWEAWQGLTHKPFLAMENIYHSPYVLEWWSVKRGLRVIADLFRAGKKGEDPVMTYKRMFGLSQQDFCTEMLDGYSQLLTYDWDRVREVCRPIAGRWKTKVVGREVDEQHPLPAGRYEIDPEYAPGDYGFNAIAIAPPTQGKTVTVCVEAQHRLVGVRPDGKPVYFEGDTAEGPLTQLFLVVMGAPSKHKMGNQKTYPYSFTITTGGKQHTKLLSVNS